jgi:hypothetical protein
MSKNLSIRSLPPELDLAIQREAKKNKTTKTEVVITALMKIFNLKKPQAIKRNVRTIFGKMSKAELKEFLKITSDFSTIDKELWK